MVLNQVMIRRWVSLCVGVCFLGSITYVQSSSEMPASLTTDSSQSEGKEKGPNAESVSERKKNMSLPLQPAKKRPVTGATSTIAGNPLAEEVSSDLTKAGDGEEAPPSVVQPNKEDGEKQGPGANQEEKKVGGEEDGEKIEQPAKPVEGADTDDKPAEGDDKPAEGDDGEPTGTDDEVEPTKHFRLFKWLASRIYELIKSLILKPVRLVRRSVKTSVGVFLGAVAGFLGIYNTQSYSGFDDKYGATLLNTVGTGYVALIVAVVFFLTAKRHLGLFKKFSTPIELAATGLVTINMLLYLFGIAISHSERELLGGLLYWIFVYVQLLGLCVSAFTLAGFLDPEFKISSSIGKRKQEKIKLVTYVISALLVAVPIFTWATLSGITPSTTKHAVFQTLATIGATALYISTELEASANATTDSKDETDDKPAVVGNPQRLSVLKLALIGLVGLLAVVNMAWLWQGTGVSTLAAGVEETAGGIELTEEERGVFVYPEGV